MRIKHSGFTMLELVITLIILGMMLGMGLPAMSKMIQSSAVRQVTNELVRDFNVARSQAVDLNQIVTVCRRSDATTCHTGGTNSNKDWQDSGWLVFVDVATADQKPDSDAEILRETLIDSQVTIDQEIAADTTFKAAFSFFPDGTIKDSNLSRVNGVVVTMKICPASNTVKGRRITISERGDIRTDILSALSDCVDA